MKSGIKMKNMKVNRLLVVVVATLLATLGFAFLPTHQVAQDSQYTIKVFPKRIRGTWYTYDTYDKKTVRIRITEKKMMFGKSISRLHSRKTTAYPKVGAKVKHPSWIIGYNFKYKNEKWTQMYGWYQSAGAGSFYRRVQHKIHGKKYSMLQLAGGAGISTFGYAYHSKKEAKANANRWFSGDRHQVVL
ncbi:hypothetical protein EFS12_02090 [Levilactobacillus brevis]|nr:hypothetical protein [Levilactobacillus brevis]MCT3586988.1 hypothetical protein [Levilactobacillus brevis]